uniref:Uncharacterized protein n=1 Tax=viral metagenome TaxID=1070528 RepID=A0A6C0DRN4_9ZZZZ
MNRQQTIFLLPLPYDIIHIINSYCFYDIVTWKTRIAKKQIVNKFNKAYASRARPDESWLEDEYDTNTSENWLVYLIDKDILCDPKYLLVRSDNNFRKMYKETLFQAMNCKTCGNYKMSKTTKYSVYELDHAFVYGDDLWLHEIRSRMTDRLRCECSIENEFL